MTYQTANISYDKNTLALSGSWSVNSLDKVDSKIQALVPPTSKEVIIDGSEIKDLDTAGAWLVHKLLIQLQKLNKDARIIGFNAEFTNLLDIIHTKEKSITQEKIVPKLTFLEKIGLGTFQRYEMFIGWLNFIGELFVTLFVQIRHPSLIRVKYFLNVLETNGFRALPIVGFLNFLIGVVLTYQTGLKLQQYGANIFIISLLGIAIFREFAPLITAIIVAGRTGSAFTAQLGLMKANEEIDALRTMGYSSMGMLVVPRVFGLLVAMPLLIVWADVFGILGGMVMSEKILHINYETFISQFPTNVTYTTFIIGLIKAPVYALIIASVGCFHGFRVSGSSESIGLETTKSVVLAIFMIIVADALFSIILSWLNI